MPRLVPFLSYRSTVAIGLSGQNTLRSWSFATMPSRATHRRSFWGSGSDAKARDDLRDNHAASRTLSTASQDASIHDLFHRSRQAFPERWRQECWYLTTAAALIASGQQSHIGALYQHLLHTEQYNTPESRKHLVRRLREAMIKCVILVGIPKVMLAFHSLAAVEQEQDQDHSFTRAGWTPNKENNARAVQHLNTLYRGAQDKNHAACGAHADIEWISTDISYGLFLSDHSVLDITESELVILPAILCQDLKAPTDWHLVGCLRLGFTREEIDAVQNVIEKVVAYSGGSLSKIGSVWEIKDEVVSAKKL